MFYENDIQVGSIEVFELRYFINQFMRWILDYGILV